MRWAGSLGPQLFAMPILLLTVVLVPWVAKEISIERYRLFMIVGLAALQLFFAMRWWQLSVYIFLSYVMVEGFVINYYGGTPELNVLKDALLLVLAFILAVRLHQNRLSMLPSAPWLVLFFGFSFIYVAAAFNPALPSILVGVVGIRVTLLYFVCFLIGYWFFQYRGQVARFLRFQAWISLPICIFGLAQYISGPDLLLRISPGFSRAIFYGFNPNDPGAGRFFRTIGTFASTGGFAQYLWATIPMTCALYLLLPRARERSMVGGCIALQVCTLLSTGSRGALLFIILALALTLLLMERSVRSFVALAAMLVFAFAGSSILGSTVQSRFSTILEPDTVLERNMAIGVGQFVYAMEAPVQGVGAGRLASAAYRLRPEMELLGVENQVARIRFESGLAGMIVFIAFAATMFLDAHRTALRLRTPAFRTAGTFVTGYLMTVLLSLPIGLPLDVSPTNVYLWFLSGMLYAMRKLELAESQLQAQAAGRPLSAPAVQYAQ